MDAKTVQELGAMLTEMRAADDPIVMRNEWDDLIDFLAAAHGIPRELTIKSDAGLANWKRQQEIKHQLEQQEKRR